jgi:catechol 2,3-dioxygenase-like lactoylglutathione lyase family enzyme
MFDHVTIRVADRPAAERFYRTVLGTLGIEPSYAGADMIEWDDFSIGAAEADRSPTRHLHVAFVAPSREHVDAFWRAGVDAGYEDDGRPGERPIYHRGYYGAYVLDPDGNNVESVFHDRGRS